MNDNALRKAMAYLRTSSAANVGPDKDSERRQREAIDAFARAAGYEIVQGYYDAAVSGADPITARPGFSAMLERLLSNGVRTILVETASRFARDLIVQETGYVMLRARGIELIAVDSPDSFVADTPTANLIRQVLGAVSEFEKAMLVEKLRGARERKRRETGKKVGGRKSYAEIEGGPELIALAKKLHRYPVNGRRRTLADIAKALADAGYWSSAGTPYTPTAVSRMLASKGSERTTPPTVGETSTSSPLEVDPHDATVQVTDVVNRDVHWKSSPQPVAAEPLAEAAEGTEPGLQTPLGSRW